MAPTFSLSQVRRYVEETLASGDFNRHWRTIDIGVEAGFSHGLISEEFYEEWCKNPPVTTAGIPDKVEMLAAYFRDPKGWNQEARWSKAMGPEEAGALYGVSGKQFVRWYKQQERGEEASVRIKRLTSRRYMIRVEDLPDFARR